MPKEKISFLFVKERVKIMKYADLHSHILPYLDDGAKDIDSAVELVVACLEQDIDTIVCTPHFSPATDKSVLEFIKKRDESFRLLQSELKKRNIDAPNMLLGAEVLFDCDLSEVENLEMLAFTNTGYILLEMPDVTWQNWMFDYIYNLIAQKNLIPIIAHIERYTQTKEAMDKLKRLEVFFQVNASSVVHKRHHDVVSGLLKNKDVHFISTDTHSIKSRPPELKVAMEIIKSKYSSEYAETLCENSYKVIKNEICDKRELEYYTYDIKKKRGFFGRFFK